MILHIANVVHLSGSAKKMLKISKATHQKRQKYPPPPIGYSIRFITFAANIVTMGNWEKLQEEKKLIKEKDKTRKEKLAGYFFDLSKLSFAGLVISLILPLFSNVGDVKMWLAAFFGIILTVLSALLANKILK